MTNDQIYNFNNSERIYCDNVSGGFNKEIFLVGMFTGQEADVYALTPAHTKRFAIWLNTQIAAYEKSFGEIDANLPTPIVSPIQASDIQSDVGNSRK